MTKDRTCLNCDRLMPAGRSLRNGRCEPCNRHLDRKGRERGGEPGPPPTDTRADAGVDWSQAACLSTDPDMFVPDVGQAAWEAKAVCRTACPIVTECRAFGLSVHPATYMGVYGALSQEERRDIRAGRLTEDEVDARDADVIAAGGWRSYTGNRGGEAKRRQAEQRQREVA